MNYVTALNGIGKIHVGDAIWPIANLLASIFVAIMTYGLGSVVSIL